ncbi:MAG: hypothetical protein GTN86_11455 [Xanthomonadales bacterium]|nr:hypothetical protein [Xanthomonadales bacterium]NIN60350.1 hypothetical protein [Xanthomonadales bacterium]NIN75702.1 hypothetical protein [Xanthomonadales bacterium]NIO14775.1 hypothetical protein [Xanthomonadales bacterium]NIP12743.1 hypothetical protein [Xanthomonadales bacterium]
MTAASDSIRALLAPIDAHHVLLPHAVIAEVIPYAPPRPYRDAPPWLLGEIEWNDWQVPVVSLGRLGKFDRSPSSGRARHILIVKTLSESTSVVHIGFPIYGLPGLRTVTADNLEPLDAPDLSPAIFSLVRLGEDQAIIPELDELSGLIEAAVFSK